ncbi:MAG: NIPSNAP family protein [Acidobacteria bacterium]|nr:NIPSNAP family protein [Acidobacteriota bacterium]
MNKLIKSLLVTAILCCISIIASAQTTTPPPANAPAPLTLAPSPSLSKYSRCYEIRTYTAAPGKLEELHARFRNHTMKYFKKHGMEVVGFWGPADKENGSENKLVYILVFPSRDALQKAWNSFRADPGWLAARAESEKNGRLVEKVESVILMATDYAPKK